MDVRGKVIYVLTKNGVLITRAFQDEYKAQVDCRVKNSNAPEGIHYSYVRILLADS